MRKLMHFPATSTVDTDGRVGFEPQVQSEAATSVKAKHSVSATWLMLALRLHKLGSDMYQTSGI